MPGKRTAPAVVECIIPILSVKDLAASVRFYLDVLGFSLDWGDALSTMASVSRDGKAIMLCQQSQGQPGTWIWIGVEDIEPLYRQYSASGARFQELPTNYPWAYEMRVEDPDGHVLRFGSEPRLHPAEPSGLTT
jgi:catechol 2,3-dioxygenase-like lactoylglutathione lyase family enzyme